MSLTITEFFIVGLQIRREKHLTVINYVFILVLLVSNFLMHGKINTNTLRSNKHHDFYQFHEKWGKTKILEKDILTTVMKNTLIWNEFKCLVVLISYFSSIDVFRRVWVCPIHWFSSLSRVYRTDKYSPSMLYSVISSDIHSGIRKGLFALEGAWYFTMISSFPGECVECKNKHSHLWLFISVKQEIFIV